MDICKKNIGNLQSLIWGIISFSLLYEIIYIILKTKSYYEKVFEGFIEIPMEDNINHFRFDSHSDIFSNGNN